MSIGNAANRPIQNIEFVVRYENQDFVFKFPELNTLVPGKSSKFILPFKDFLGRHVDLELYALRPVPGELSRATPSPNAPSGTKISMDDGSLWDEKFSSALRSYQLQNRGKIIAYGKKYLGWDKFDPRPQSDMTPEDIKRLRTPDGRVFGQQSNFESEYGRIGDATFAVMLNWTAQNDVLPTGKVRSGFGYYEEGDGQRNVNYFSTLTATEKENAKEFQRLNDLLSAYMRLQRSSASATDLRNFLDNNGIVPADPAFELAEEGIEDRTSIKYERNDSGTHTISYENIVSGPQKVTVSNKVYEGMTTPPRANFVGQESGLYHSIRLFVWTRQSLLSGPDKAFESVDDALKHMQTPSPASEDVPPWEDDQFIYVYVDTEYTLDEESELLSFLGSRPSGSSKRYPTIKKGTNQRQLLQDLREALYVDGDFGSKSLKALKEYYNESPIEIEGITEESQWDKVKIDYDRILKDHTGESASFPKFAQIKKGAKAKKKKGNDIHSNVQALQYVLFCDSNLEFDADLEEDVKSFQKKHKLKQDGKVGHKTWSKLLSVKKTSRFQILKNLKLPQIEPIPGQTYNLEYLTMTLASRAMDQVFTYYNKEKSWQVDLRDESTKELYPNRYNPTSNAPIKLSFMDYSIFEFEETTVAEPVVGKMESDSGNGKVWPFCTPCVQADAMYLDYVNSYGASPPIKKYPILAKDIFFIPPQRPNAKFKVKFAIDKLKFNQMLSAGAKQVVNAFDAGIIGIETAMGIYDKVAPILKDPAAAFELAQDVVERSINNYVDSKVEAISDIKRDIAKVESRDIRNGWQKLRRKSQKKKRAELLKKNKENSLKSIQTRDSNLLGGSVRFETRTFKKILDKVADKIRSMSSGFEDMKKENKQIKQHNKNPKAKHKSNPYSAYDSYFQAKPPINLNKDAERLEKVYDALEGFLKKNGYAFDGKFHKFIEIKFEKVRGAKGEILGSSISSISHVGPASVPNDVTLGVIETNENDQNLTTANTEDLDLSVRKMEIGFRKLINSSPFNNPKTMAYLSQLLKINEDLFRSGWGSRCGQLETVPAMDFISRYSYPSPDTTSLIRGGFTDTKAKDDETPVITSRSNMEEELGALMSQIKTSTTQLSEKMAAMDPKKVDSIVQFKRGKTYDANDLLPLGELCTWEEIMEKVVNAVDLSSWWCEFSACMPDIPWPIVLDFKFELPRLPKLPTWKDLVIILDAIYLNLIESLIRFLCTIVNKLLDVLRLPNCDDVFDAALYGAASLANAIKEHDKARDPVPIGGYDISSEFLRGKAEAEVKVQKKMLVALESYGIPKNLISDPDSGIDGQTMTKMIDDISAVATPSEITSLLRGNPKPEILETIKTYMKLNFKSLSKYLNNEDAITDFFENLGGLIDIEVLNKIDQIPQSLAQNRFCVEALDARQRIITGDLSTDQLARAISAHKEQSKKQSAALTAMLKSNPIETQVKDIYNPGDPNAIISTVPAPMQGIIKDASKSLFEVPKFSFMVDLSSYVRLLYSKDPRDLEYEDPEYNIEAENKALEAIDILSENEALITSVLSGPNIIEKWRLREKLYQKYQRSAVVVERTLVPPSSGGRQRGRLAQWNSSVTVYNTVSDDLARQLMDRKLNLGCGDYEDLDRNGETDVFIFVRRDGPWRGKAALANGATNTTEFNLSGVKSAFKLSDYIPNDSPTESNLMKVDKEPYEIFAPLLRRDSGQAIKSPDDLNNVSDAERTTLLQQITDSLISRISEMQNHILRHIEINMSSKNDSSLLPIIRKYYDRSEEAKRERRDDGTELFTNSDNNNSSQYTFELKLPKEFNSKIKYTEYSAEGRDNPFRVEINDRVMSQSDSSYYGCDLLPVENTRPQGVTSFGKRDIYVSSVKDSISSLLESYRSEEYNPDSALQRLDRFFDRDTGEIGVLLYSGVYPELFESFFEEVLDQLSDSRIFTDNEYIENLEKRIRGDKQYDKNGCLISESKGVIDFVKIVEDASSRVMNAFEDPSFHPSNTDFNSGSIGPFEIGIIHSCIYLMVSFLMVEFALRGGVAFSTYSAKRIFSPPEQGPDDQNQMFFKNYLADFIIKSIKDIEQKRAERNDLTYLKSVMLQQVRTYVETAAPERLTGIDGETKRTRESVLYVVDQITSQGDLLDMIESIFRGVEEPNKSFAKVFVENAELQSVPHYSSIGLDKRPEDGPRHPHRPSLDADAFASVGAASSEGLSWHWKIPDLQDPDQVQSKGRFFLQHYIKVHGPAASQDFSEYAFSPGFNQVRESLLEDLRNVNVEQFEVAATDEREERLINANEWDNTRVDAAERDDIALRIEERLMELEDISPLPGALDDVLQPGGRNVELVAVTELEKYLRDSYQSSFNEEMCELLGLIYTDDPQDVCFMMPVEFRKYPGKYIKRKVVKCKIDRGFGDDLASMKWQPVWKVNPSTSANYDERFENIVTNLQEFFQTRRDHSFGSRSDADMPFRIGGGSFFNDVFDLDLVAENLALPFKEGIFSKCGRKGRLGNLTIEEQTEFKYYAFPEDGCQISSDLGQERINKILELYQSSDAEPAESTEKKADLLSDMEMKNFAKSFQPTESLDLEIKESVRETVSAIERSRNAWVDNPESEGDGFVNHRRSMNSGPDLKVAAVNPSFKYFNKDDLKNFEKESGPLLPPSAWHIGEVSEAEFNMFVSSTMEGYEVNPDPTNDGLVFGPNGVHEEWTQYLIEDPGYIFDKPGESMHHPASMGSMAPPRRCPGIVHRGGEIIPRGVNDTTWTYMSYHTTMAFLELNFDLDFRHWGYADQRWGHGQKPVLSGDVARRDDNREGYWGHMKYDRVFRFNRPGNEWDFELNDYPRWAPVQGRPLGYQNTSYAFEDTNELGPNDYACPVLLSITKVDYKIGDQILRTEYYMGSEFDDDGVLKGEAQLVHPNNVEGNRVVEEEDAVFVRDANSYKRKGHLTRAVNRLMMEWQENTYRVAESRVFGPDSEYVRGYLEEKLQQFASVTVGAPDDLDENGINLGQQAFQSLSAGDVQRIIWSVLVAPLTLANPVFADWGGSTPYAIRSNSDENDYVPSVNISGTSRLRAARPDQAFSVIPEPVRSDVIAKVSRYLNEPGIMNLFLLPNSGDLSRRGADSSRNIGDIDQGVGQSPSEVLYSAFREKFLGEQSTDPEYGLRPLSRQGESRYEGWTASFSKSKYQTNMMTTSKIYSAAAILSKMMPVEEGDADPLMDPILPPGWRDRTTDFVDDSGTGHDGTLGSLHNAGEPRVPLELADDDEEEWARANSLLRQSAMVDRNSFNWGDDAFVLDSENPESLPQNLAKMCNIYTEGVLNTRTYEGFWGYTSSPHYLKGFSFKQYMTDVHDALGTGIRYSYSDPMDLGTKKNPFSWHQWFQFPQTFPAICDRKGGNELNFGIDQSTRFGPAADEYDLRRLPYPEGYSGRFANKSLPTFEGSPHLLVGDGKEGSDRDREINALVTSRGDLDGTTIGQSAASEQQATGFVTFLHNKVVQLTLRMEHDERRFWDAAGSELATPRDEQDTMANYALNATEGPPPRGVFERLNVELREDMSRRLQEIIRSSNYTLGVRMVQILSAPVSATIDEILSTAEPGRNTDPLVRSIFDLMLLEERLVKVKMPNSGVLYALPITKVEKNLDSCKINWRSISRYAHGELPSLLRMLAASRDFKKIVEDSFPLQRMSMLSSLYSVMTLSTKEGFDTFMDPAKSSILDVIAAIHAKDNEPIPNGIDMWLKANGFMTSEGPQPTFGDFVGPSLDAFFTALLENAVMTPVVILRTLAGTLDPAYKAMMKSQGTGPGSIKKLTWDSVTTTGVSKKMKNGVTCDGNYAPISTAFPADLASSLIGTVPTSAFWKSLSKLGRYIKRKRRGGVNDSYGDFLGPFGLLALSLPELPGEKPATVAARKADSPEICADVDVTTTTVDTEDDENGDNNSEQGN